VKVDVKELKYEEMTFELLPPQAVELIKKNDINIDLAKKNIVLFWRIAMFFKPDAFSMFHIAKPDDYPWINDDTIAKYRTIIEEVDSLKTMKRVFTKITIIGEGAFGCVYMAKEVESKQYIAIKKLPHKEAKEQRHNFYEGSVLSILDHPNIIKYHKSILVEQELWIVTEYIHGGTLADAIRAYKFTDNHCAYFVREIVKALSYLHQHNLAHRDLKSRNVMLDSKGSVKLIDFGLCADFSTGNKTRILGSPFWISPEMINGNPHSLNVDIWSLGVIALEIHLQTPPIYESAVRCMFTVATEGLKHLIPYNATEDAKSFMNFCLEQDPNLRPYIREVEQHAWVNRYGISQGIQKVLSSLFLGDALSLFNQ